MDISAHYVREISATAHHSGGTHWIDVEIIENDLLESKFPTPSRLTFFMWGENAKELADRYAAAINSVNANSKEMEPA